MPTDGGGMLNGRKCLGGALRSVHRKELRYSVCGTVYLLKVGSIVLDKTEGAIGKDGVALGYVHV